MFNVQSIVQVLESIDIDDADGLARYSKHGAPSRKYCVSQAIGVAMALWLPRWFQASKVLTVPQSHHQIRYVPTRRARIAEGRAQDSKRTR